MIIWAEQETLQACMQWRVMVFPFQKNILDTMYLKLGEFTMVSQPIRLNLVDWFVFHFY
jgi:hypothetical protein